MSTQSNPPTPNTFTGLIGHWLIVDDDRRVTGCHCGFPAAESDEGYGDSVVGHLYRAGALEQRRLVAFARSLGASEIE